MVRAVADRHDVECLGRGQHMTMTGAGVVSMAMGDQRPVNAAHRIDVEIARRTIKPLAAGNEQLVRSERHPIKLGRQQAKRKGLHFPALGSIG